METALAIILVIVGSTLGLLTTKLSQKPDHTKGKEAKPGDSGGGRKVTARGFTLDSATTVLSTFLVVVIAFSMFTVIRYWEEFLVAQDKLVFGTWLFLSMVGGMFVEVLTRNYHNGKKWFDVTASQLLFPLLFSVMVFYPVWITATNASDSMFAIYAAFVNGFYWRSIVANTQPVKPADDDKANDHGQ